MLYFAWCVPGVLAEVGTRTSVTLIIFISRWLTSSDCSRAVCRSSFSTVRLQSEHTHRGSWRALGVLLRCDELFWPGIPASEGMAPSLRSHRHRRQRSPAVYGARWFKPNVNGVWNKHEERAREREKYKAHKYTFILIKLVWSHTPCLCSLLHSQ